MIINKRESARHCITILEDLYKHDEFMMSIDSLVDFGCGDDGFALDWWSTRTTPDEAQQPLNIRCFGVDNNITKIDLPKRTNVTFLNQDYNDRLKWEGKPDVGFSHNSFQYSVNPLGTLKHWYNTLADGAMLIISVPQTTNLEGATLAFDQPSLCYFNWTPASMIYALAVNGFDCRDGFFRKDPDSPWIDSIVYKSDIEPMDPATTSWYDLLETDLLPESAVKSIMAHGYVRQRDLVLPWLDKNLQTYQHL